MGIHKDSGSIPRPRRDVGLLPLLGALLAIALQGERAGRFLGAGVLLVARGIWLAADYGKTFGADCTGTDG